MRKWLVLLFLLAGCNGEDAEPFVQTEFKEEVSGVQSIVAKDERIQKRQLVAADDTVLVTYEVKPAYRIQKEHVERDLQKALQKAYPTLKFVVSGDFKLHYEAQQLAKKEPKSVKKKIEQLKKLAEEET